MFNKIQKQKIEEQKRKAKEGQKRIVDTTEEMLGVMNKHELNWFESMDVITNLMNNFFINISGFMRRQSDVIKKQNEDTEK